MVGSSTRCYSSQFPTAPKRDSMVLVPTSDIQGVHMTFWHLCLVPVSVPSHWSRGNLCLFCCFSFPLTLLVQVVDSSLKLQCGQDLTFVTVNSTLAALCYVCITELPICLLSLSNVYLITSNSRVSML